MTSKDVLTYIELNQVDGVCYVPKEMMVHILMQVRTPYDPKPEPPMYLIKEASRSFWYSSPAEYMYDTKDPIYLAKCEEYIKRTQNRNAFPQKLTYQSLSGLVELRIKKDD
jgi:hypothetical protein